MTFSQAISFLKTKMQLGTSSMQEENLERRFRLAALRSERAELYHLRATREISNETLQKLLHDLDLLEALLIENQ